MLRGTLIVVAVMLCLTRGVSGEGPPPDLKNGPAVYAQRKEKERAWIADNAAASYKAAGEHGAWDGDALTSLQMVLAPPKDLKWQALRDKQTELLTKAVAAGCRDPLVRYYNRIIVGEPQGTTTDEQLIRFKALAKAMMESKYPAFWKLVVEEGYAAYLEKRSRNDEDTTNPTQAVLNAIDLAFPLWKESLKDKDVPDDALYEIAERLGKQHHAWARMTTDRAEYFSRYFEPWVAARPSSSAAYALKCEVYNLYADDKYFEASRNPSVKIFGPEDPKERTAMARAAGEKAWEINPLDPLAANNMMWVSLRERAPRAEMERWFARSSNLDPNSLDACLGKAWWLQWRGDADGMKFARDCVRTADAGSQRLFVLLRIHQMLSEVSQMNSPDLYYKSPEVFADMQLSYEKVLGFEPENREFRSRYAFYAMRAKQWSIAKKQFDVLGDHPDVTPFGNMTLYKYERRRADRMLEEGKSTI